jgi:hypothetical protein
MKVTKWDWDQINSDIQNYYESSKVKTFTSVSAVANWLDIPRATVRDAFSRGDLDASFVVAKEKEDKPPEWERMPKEFADVIDQVDFKKRGNEATLKYKAAEPLSSKEACEIAGVDLEEWRIVDQRVNMWQMGRKAKKVDLNWVDGSATGYVKDTGEIHKTYLYQVEVKLTRRNRVAVKPAITPIKFETPYPFATQAHPQNRPEETILHITDPHFGFIRQLDGELEPIHDRIFLASLLRVAELVKVDNVVWGGDMFDLADFSSFDSEPGLLYNVQLSALELAWVLAQFRHRTDRQIILEGNHDERMQRALVKNLKSAYQLKPVHELDGHPLLSIPRLLDLDSLDTEWIDGWPNNYINIGQVRFEHGNTVRSGSGRTASSEVVESTFSKFFGHIHRHELVQKWLPDQERSIYVGTPGCACRREFTPGSSLKSNWQKGAFLIHLRDGVVDAVEHIPADELGAVTFRGVKFSVDYMSDFIDFVPSEFTSQFSYQRS